MATKGKTNVDGDWLCRQEAVQAYTTLCCQNAQGGLKDKPTKGPDPYHTMYSLAGNSIMQHRSDYDRLHADTPEAKEFRAAFDGNYGNMLHKDASMEERDKAEADMTTMFAGVLSNKLRRLNPVFNVRFDYVEKAKAYYRNKKAGTIPVVGNIEEESKEA